MCVLKSRGMSAVCTILGTRFLSFRETIFLCFFESSPVDTVTCSMAAADKNEVEVDTIPAARVAVIGCGWWAQGEQCHLLPSFVYQR